MFFCIDVGFRIFGFIAKASEFQLRGLVFLL